MINPNFDFLGNKNKIEEANKLNNEFEKVYMNCDDWSYDECVSHIRYTFIPIYLTYDEYEEVLGML